MGMLNLNDMLGKAFGGQTKKRKCTVEESHEFLVADESDKLLDEEKILRESIEAVEQNGIVFFVGGNPNVVFQSIALPKLDCMGELCFRLADQAWDNLRRL